MFEIEHNTITDQQAQLLADDSYYSRFTNTTTRAVRHLIDSQGPYDRIGSGLYGTVYGHDNSNIVYKTGQIYHTQWSESDTQEICTDAYWCIIQELAKLKKHNKFFPKIYGCRVYQYNDETPVYVVAMERLKSMVQMHDINNIKEWRLFRNEIYSSSVCPVRRWKYNPTQFKQAISLLNTVKVTHNKSWDLHSGNFMWRENRIVITDPLV
jgi:hypothetical protein